MKTAEKIKKPKAPTLEQYQGYLFARLHLIGSFSQGPCYYLQPLKGEDLLLFKRVELWKDDPVLHACLGRKVTVFGSKIKKSEEEAESEPGIRYAYLLNEEIPLEIRLDLGLPDDTLWINKMPAPSPKYPPELKKLPLKLSVRWPYREEEGQERSIWSGECPTSQLFDFGIEDPHGHTIWQWGNCMLFRPEPTKWRSRAVRLRPSKCPGSTSRIPSLRRASMWPKPALSPPARKCGSRSGWSLCTSLRASETRETQTPAIMRLLPA